MKKLEDTKVFNDVVKSHKGLKFMSAITMALPMFLGTTEKAFAVQYMKTVPKSTIVKDHSMGTHSFGRVYLKDGSSDNIHAGWHDKNDVRYYCLAPTRYTPSIGQTSTLASKASADLRGVLRTGFGINSSEDLGYPTSAAPALEYATQVAVWNVAGLINPSRTEWYNQTAHNFYNYIMKHYKENTAPGATTISIKPTKGYTVGKKKRHLTVWVHENGKLRHAPVTLKFKGVKVVQDNKELKSGTTKLNTNHSFTAELTGSGSTTGGKEQTTTNPDGSTTTKVDLGSGSLTATTKKYNLEAYKYTNGGNQPGVALIALEDGNISDTYKWSGQDSGKTSPPPVHKDNKIKAMFDLKKNDDEGDAVNQAKFDVYEADENWSLGNKIGTITTNENGVARSGELDPGHYVAIEASTGKNLDIDQTPVHIDLTEDNLKQNAKVTHIKQPDGKSYDLYHLTVNGPINNHKQLHLTSEATNLEDNSKYAQPIKGPVVLNERLHLAHLVGTAKYTAKAWLVDKATGQPITIDGKQIEVTKTFGSPNNDNNDDGIEDNLDLQLKIPEASSLAGKDIVVFSHVERTDKPSHWSVDHQDVNDKHETVHFSNPQIRTKAINQETKGNSLQPTDGETLTDTITYKELIPGKTYTVKGIVMDKQSGKAVMNNGKKVEFSKTFTAENANGEVDASVTFDAHHYYNHDLVVYETLYYTGYYLTEHRDINDSSQTLHVTHPQMHTTLSYNAQKLVYAKTQNIAEDVIRYTDLIPGQTYEIRGKLMDQVTGLPVVQNGVPIVLTARFTPRMQNGTVTVTFKFNGMPYVGHTLVAFETLYYNGRVVMEHADLNDASESIVIDHYKRNTPPVVVHGGGSQHGGTVVINNNNNNNNNNQNNDNNNNSNNGNNGNNSSNNGNNGNNGNNSSNNGNNGNSGNNSSNNGNNGNNRNQSSNNGNNGSNSSNNGNNQSSSNWKPSNTVQYVKPTNESGNSVVDTRKPTSNNFTSSQKSQNTQPVTGNNSRVIKETPAKSTPQPSAKKVGQPVQNTQKQETPAQAPVLSTPSEQPAQQKVSAVPVLTSTKTNGEVNSSNDTLPQTGNKKSNVFIQLIGLGLIMLPAMAMVEYIRRHQSSGLD